MTGTCGRRNQNVLDRRNYTHTNGLTYDCQIDTSVKDNKVRRTQCTPSCISKQGDQLCCRVKSVNYRKRIYTCSLNSGEQSTQLQGSERSTISVSLLARQEKQCECFKCSDVVCPTSAPPPTSCSNGRTTTQNPNDTNSNSSDKTKQNNNST